MVEAAAALVPVPVVRPHHLTAAKWSRTFSRPLEGSSSAIHSFLCNASLRFWESKQHRRRIEAKWLPNVRMYRTALGKAIISMNLKIRCAQQYCSGACWRAVRPCNTSLRGFLLETNLVCTASLQPCFAFSGVLTCSIKSRPEVEYTVAGRTW